MKNAEHGPPRMAINLLRRFCDLQRLEELEGDLQEQFNAQVRDAGVLKAHLVYWRDVLLLSANPSLKEQRERPYQQARGPIMLNNYVKMALRNLRRHKGYSLINVTGLAVGMACCLLIMLFVQDELSYDRFHEKADRIYRLERDVAQPGNQGRYSFTSGPPGPALVREYPEVEAAVRFFRTESLVRYADRQFYGEQVAFVDSSFFHVFSFPLLEGDPATALAAPNSIVLTASMAAHYFGDADPLGQTVRLDNEDDFVVTGVVADVPENSHYRFDALASFSTLLPKYAWFANWGSIGVRTYVLLSPAASATALEAKLPSFVRQHKGEEAQEAYYLRPLQRIHLYSDVWEIDPQGDVETVYIFSAIALFILLLACINYMNLATARAARRAQEVGVRKVVGATRWQLVVQFLSESVLLTMGAMVSAFVLAFLSLPLLNAFLERHLTLGVLVNGSSLAILGGFCLLVGMLAGTYPAFYLTRFQPSRVLKGTLHTARAGVFFRRVLVVAQFVVSIALLVATTVVYQQVRYLEQKHLGFDKEHVVNIQLRDAQLLDAADVLQQQLLNDPQVLNASISSSGVSAASRSGMAAPATAEDPSKGAMTDFLFVDPEFIPTMGIAVVAGRNFSRERVEESALDVLINETAARRYGWSSPEEAIGQQVRMSFFNGGATVIGVVKDFHIYSLRSNIRPLMMIHFKLNDDAVLAVRLRAGNVPAALTRFEAIWKDVVPDWPFEYAFLDEELDQQYKRDQQTGYLFGVFAGLAIFIACLGLFGLAAFMAEQRTKEIGIRKVLGASVPDILLLMSKHFIGLVLVAAVLATPVVYLAMNRWLADFAYRVALSWWIFPMAGLVVLVLAWLTVSYQSTRAALADPVKSLRHE